MKIARKGFTLLQSASVNKEGTACSDCGSSYLRRQRSSFTSIYLRGQTPSTVKAGPVLPVDELPNKGILNLPIPRPRV